MERSTLEGFKIAGLIMASGLVLYSSAFLIGTNIGGYSSVSNFYLNSHKEARERELYEREDKFVFHMGWAGRQISYLINNLDGEKK